MVQNRFAPLEPMQLTFVPPVISISRELQTPCPLADSRPGTRPGGTRRLRGRWHESDTQDQHLADWHAHRLYDAS
jgi:hypothetical protein